MTASELFIDLVRHTHAVIDRHGEAHTACPWCGRGSSPKDPHCSFNERGWKCFTCGEGHSLAALAHKVGLDTGKPYQNAPIRLQEAPRRPASWLSNAEHLCSQYERSQGRLEAWKAYKPVSVETIQHKRLGLGVLPASHCRHERLIVPIIDGTEIVGFRGRQLDCDCKGKWLAPGDTRIDLYPLYNSDSLKTGQVVWIMENTIDALLFTESTPYVGVATYSVAYWYQSWLNTLKAARPEMVIVAYDNDLPGNGGAARRQEFIDRWLETHPTIPVAAGSKLVNILLRAGLPAVLYDWGRAEEKSDIGSLLMKVRA